uniref:Chaoptin n=1 Tax=Timema bartmani TaxID=61472 RepID=A0A7R9FCY8_9NEOP|nr:unnamed protein product [Timema bartmani]
MSLQVLGNLTILNIDGHEFESLPTDAFGAGLVPNHLEKLHLTNGRLSVLPTEALAPLRKLKVLDLHGNHLKDLKKNQFRGLRDAEVLDLSFNNITKLDSSHLADLNKMSWCNLSNNAILELTR